jgi:hypothetical protein
MRRLYFLVPNVELAQQMVNELLIARITDKHIHVLAKRGTPLCDLPEASLLQKSDFIPAVEHGVALGGLTGTLAGLVAVSIPPAWPVVAGGIILATTLAGAGVGAWLGGMVGMNVANTRVTQFEEAIEKGELLMMIDVPLTRVDEIERLVKQNHPEAKPEGTEPHIPAFP